MVWPFDKAPVVSSEMRDRIAELKLQLAEANAKLQAYEDETTKASVEIDFNQMRVFSIERNFCNDRPCTIVGYYMNDPVISADGEMIVNRDKVKEWTLYCDAARHQELVKEFKKWKTEQNGN